MSRAHGAAASAPKPPCSIMQTTTSSGWPAGAQDAYHEWSSPGGASAVPVLPATGTGYVEKIAAEVPTCAASYSPWRIAFTSVNFSLRWGLKWKGLVTRPCTTAAAACGGTTVPPCGIVGLGTAIGSGRAGP